MTVLTVLPILGFAGCSLAAGIGDAQTLRIPNRLNAVILALFALHALTSLTLAETATALGLSASVLVIGFAAYAKGLLGGGDAKLLAVCTAWAGLPCAGEFLAITGLAGGAIALALSSSLTANLADGLRRDWPGTASAQRASMPYGAAIAAGAISVVFELLSR